MHLSYFLYYLSYTDLCNKQKNITHMGPKKKAQPGAEDNAQKVEFLTNKVIALQNQIVWQQQRSDRSKTQQKMLRDEIVRIDKQFFEEKNKLYDISNKMKQQYNNTQQQLISKVKVRKQQLIEKQEQIRKSKQTLKNAKADYDDKLRQKQRELNQLRQKMEDMSIEFSRMLRETLEKMQQRIELQQWDNQSDPQLIKKMKDLSDLYSN